jgi:hypothetical protein
MSRSPLSGLSEAERAQAYERFGLIRPFLGYGGKDVPRSPSGFKGQYPGSRGPRPSE